MAIKNIKALFTKGTVNPSKGVVPIKAVAVKKTATKQPLQKSSVSKTVHPKPVSVKKVAVKKIASTKTVVTKKVVAKKSAPKKSVVKRLVVASDSESFWVSDGQVLNSLVALEAAFKTMKPAAFTHHLTTDSNHFAEWVEAVLMDAECALALRGAENATAAHIIVSKHLKTYNK